MERLLFDLRHAVRQLVRSPGFSSAAVLILGLGIGTSTAVFSVVDSVLFRPLRLPDSERLITLCEAHEGDRAYCTASPPNAMDWQANVHTLQALGVARDRGIEIRTGDRRISLAAAMATPGFLRAVGVQPLHGRLLTEDDMMPHGNGRVIVLSYGLWQNEYGGNPDIIGSSITVSSGGDGATLDNEPVTVVGVLPDGVEVPRLGYARAWIPLQLDPRSEQYRDWRGFVTLARLADGATMRAAELELNRIQASLAEAYPEAVRNWTVHVVRLRDFVTSDVRPLLLLFLAAVGLVLAIVCVNLMGLLLARATKRQHELTVRAALGAGRGRLLEQLLAEASVLAIIGGAAGVLIATWLVHAFVALAPPGVPRVAEVTVDGRILAFSIVVTAVSGLLFGLAPAARIRGMRLRDTLQLGRTMTADRTGNRVRNILVVGELALALSLVLSAGLLLRSFGRVVAFNPGFELERLLTFQVYPPMWRYETRAQVSSFYRDAKEALEAIPGVTAVGTASAGPLIGGGDGRTPFLVHGRPDVPVQDAPTVQWFDAGPDYFPTLGVPIVQGRNLSESDAIGSTVTALINQTMAARHWPDSSPIGARLALPQWDTEVEIVGVVQDLHTFDAPAATEPSIFVSNRQRPRWATFFVVRTAGDPGAVVASVRRAFERLDPDAVPQSVMTMEERLAEQLVRPRFNLLLIALFAAIALVLGAAGIYAVIAYTVAMRTREFGIRMALGARRAQVLGSVLLDGGKLLGGGLLLGTIGAFYFTRLLRGVIRDVAPSDPFAVIGTVLVLGLTGVIATLAPALRASRTEPVTVLRSE
jgi:putative ABC transport system permease protein